jgi:ABC-type polar amino acid transport system ATPase subunit
MIRIQGLRKTFGDRKVIDGFDAQVEAGRIVAIVGSSGSGKTTLLRCLNALEAFDSGSIEIAGHRLEPGSSNAGRVDALRADVGLVFQEHHLFPHLNALDNVTLAPRIVQKLTRAEADKRGMSWLDRVGLGDRANARPHELSGGQKQRVCLARALAQGVQVLLLDEPTSALDPETRTAVRDLLLDVSRRAHEKPLTLVVVTHDPNLARQLADEVWVMDQGALAEAGAPAQLVSAPKTHFAREFLRGNRPN